MSSNDKPAPSFTIRDILEEMVDLDQDVDLGEKLTTREFMKILKLGSPGATRNRIRPLVMNKVLIPVQKEVTNMAGIDTRVAAYAANPTADWKDVERALGLI